jgi:hypothetical protein
LKDDESGGRELLLSVTAFRVSSLSPDFVNSVVSLVVFVFINV